MNKNSIITEYKEDLEKKADELLQPGSVIDPETPVEDGEDELTVMFRESPSDKLDPLIYHSDDELAENDVVEFSEDINTVEDIPGVEEDMIAEVEPERLPGSDVDVNMLKDNEEPEEEVETNWAEDRDVSKFMSYIVDAYSNGIPKHDGTSIVGAERAINYLNDLNKQISEALRMDKNNELDSLALDKMRVSMMKDMMTLKNHIKDLQKRVRDSHKKNSSLGESNIVKEGSIPIPTLVMTPFERAIAGIIINSVISAGHPFEDVYEHLKKKYELSDREELAIMQLVMDMGYPLFKDRGTFSTDKADFEGAEQGLDFIKNYFA